MIFGQSKPGGTLMPAIICDVCGQPITRAGLGAAVFRSRGLGEEELYTIKHVHKGTCHDTAEAELTGGRRGPWVELTDHLSQVITSAGLTFDTLLMKEVNWLLPQLTPQQRVEIESQVTALIEVLQRAGLHSPLWDGPTE
jgi:hypothetical protein